MEATFDRASFLQAFEVAASVAPKRHPTPTLENVLLTVAKDEAVLQAFDSEVGITVKLKGFQPTKPGAVALPARRWLKLLRECVSQEFSLRDDDGRVTMTTDYFEARIPSGDAERFPKIERAVDSKCHVVRGGIVEDLIAQTLYAAATECARYALAGVMWELNDDKVRLVATDGKRLAIADGLGKSLRGHTTGETTPVVPTRAMELLAELINDRDTAIHACFEEKRALFEYGGTVIFCKLVDGKFPAYREIIPKPGRVMPVRLPVGPFSQSLRQVTIFRPHHGDYGVRCTFSGDQVAFEVNNPECGILRGRLPLLYDGKPFFILLDGHLLLDFLATRDPESEVTLTPHPTGSEVGLCELKAGDAISYYLVPLMQAGGPEAPQEAS